MAGRMGNGSCITAHRVLINRMMARHVPGHHLADRIRLCFQPTWSGNTGLGNRARSGYHVFLVDERWHELKSIEPHDRLLVVRVGPEGMEDIIGADRDTGVVADEPAAEAVASVDRMRADHLDSARANVSHIVV